MSRSSARLFRLVMPGSVGPALVAATALLSLEAAQGPRPDWSTTPKRSSDRPCR